MKVECLLREKNGSLVKIGDTNYDFQPNEVGDHVCIVTNAEHRKIFLGIPEGYRVYGKVAAAQFAAAAARERADELNAAAKDALKAAKEAQAIADKAVSEAEAEEKRMTDEAVLEQERENERTESIAKARQRLEDDRAGKKKNEAILQIMKENPEFNDDDATKQYHKEQVELKAQGKK